MSLFILGQTSASVSTGDVFLGKFFQFYRIVMRKKPCAKEDG